MPVVHCGGKSENYCIIKLIIGVPSMVNNIRTFDMNVKREALKGIIAKGHNRVGIRSFITEID